jgi:polyisoprenoid-binding protein YceI
MTTATTSRTWTVDVAHSNVGFITRHMMISKVRGKFTGVKGELQIPEGTAIPESIVADIDVNSVDTRDEQRDGHLRSPDFFDVANHPHLSFKSTSIRKTSETGSRLPQILRSAARPRA